MEIGKSNEPMKVTGSSEIFKTMYHIGSYFKIITGKKHPKIKLQRLRNIRILTFGSLVNQINSFQEILELEQIFQKN